MKIKTILALTIEVNATDWTSIDVERDTLKRAIQDELIDSEKTEFEGELWLVDKGISYRFWTATPERADRVHFSVKFKVESSEKVSK